MAEGRRLVRGLNKHLGRTEATSKAMRVIGFDGFQSDITILSPSEHA